MCRDLLAGWLQFGAECRHDALCHCARHDVAVHGPVLGGEVEQPQDARAGVAADVGGRRGERDGEGRGDRVIAVAEVLVEDLPADLGAGDDVADRHLVDRALVGQRERRLSQPGADPLGAGIDALTRAAIRAA